MNRWMLVGTGVCLGTACALLPAAAAQTPQIATEPVGEAAVIADTDARHWGELQGQLRMASNHPNELWRLYGAESAAKGEWRDAFAHFRRAALYADKYSQHRVSLLYWHGVGVERDPVQGYIWADLAAERGYPQFLALREKMWESLDDGQRDRVGELGPPVYAQYGDPAAKPRFAQALRRAAREVTGSRAGFVGNLDVVTPGTDGSLLGGMGGTDLSQMYQDWRRDPDQYWAVEDTIWTHGNVDVGDLEQVDSDAPAGTP